MYKVPTQSGEEGGHVLAVWKNNVLQWCPIKYLLILYYILIARRSASWSHFWQCPWETCSALAKRVGQREVGGVTWRVITASMAMS